MQRLRIGLIAPPWVAIPPPSYGGTELVIDNLARGLVAAGQDVVLFATGDSTCPVPTRWAYRHALQTVGSAEAELFHVEQAYASLAGEVDLIHDHTVIGPWRAALRPGWTPVVTTNHGPFNDEAIRRYEAMAARVPVIAISAAHAASALDVAVRAVIHHGIDVETIPFGAGDGGYVVFLGRMSPDKGADRAIRAARQAGVKILLAAKMWEPGERRYFEEKVEPLLGPDAVYVGEVGKRAKFDLLGGAIALLNPIRWPEPFGLVMVEALACGTPVISFREGSATEIVVPGVNGFLCDDQDGMARAVAAAAQLDRWVCREDAALRFSTRRMVAAHLALYRETIAAWDPATGPDHERYSVASPILTVSSASRLA